METIAIIAIIIGSIASVILAIVFVLCYIFDDDDDNNPSSSGGGDSVGIANTSTATVIAVTAAII